MYGVALELAAVGVRGLSSVETDWLARVPAGPSVEHPAGVLRVWSGRFWQEWVRWSVECGVGRLRCVDGVLVADLPSGCYKVALDDAAGDDVPPAGPAAVGRRSVFFHSNRRGTYASHCAPED